MIFVNAVEISNLDDIVNDSRQINVCETNYYIS